MKRFTVAALLALILLAGYPADTIGQTAQTELSTANSLFKAGQFAQAGKAYATIATRDPGNAESQLQLGRIALLANRLDEAQRRLEKALALQANNADAKILLAEVFYRRDDFG